MKSAAYGIPILVLFGLVALSSACSRRRYPAAPLPISLQHAKTVLYCEMVRLSESESVYIVREVWRQGPSTSPQYAVGDAVTLFEPLGSPGSFVVIDLWGDGIESGFGISGVDDGKVRIEMHVSVSELKRAVREHIDPPGARRSPLEAIGDPNSWTATVDDEVSAEIADMQRQILRNVRPADPVKTLAHVHDSHARQQANVNEAMMALERAETESELRRAHRDLEMQKYFLEAIENALKKELAKQAAEWHDDSVLQLHR